MRRPSPAVRICFATAAQHAHFCDDAGAAARRSQHEERREGDEVDIEAAMLTAAPREGKVARPHLAVIRFLAPSPRLCHSGGYGEPRRLCKRANWAKRQRS